MLRGYKNKLIYSAALGATFSLTIGSAMAAELSSLAWHVSTLESSTKLPCNSEAEYWKMVPMVGRMPNTPKLEMICKTQCAQALSAQAQQVRAKFDSALASDAAANGSSAANSANAANTSNGQAVVSQGNHSNSGAGAQAGLQQKSANAAGVAAAAKQCSQQIDSACPASNLAKMDKDMADQAKRACDELAKASDAVAAEKAKSSGGMGDMSQLASALGQALGPLAQMMGQQQQPDTSGLGDPYSSDYSTPTSTSTSTVGGTSLGTQTTNPSGTNIGNKASPNGAEFKSVKNGITGFSPAASSGSGYGSGSFGPSSGAGFGDSSGGGAGMGSTGYSSAGGSLNSSGSSMNPGSTDAEKAAAAAAAAAAEESYEVASGGGGGGRPSFLGLKGGRAEEDLGANGESVLGDLGLGDDGSRDLASADELGSADIGAEEGSTLFHVIHTKISEIKKRGSI